MALSGVLLFFSLSWLLLLEDDSEPLRPFILFLIMRSAIVGVGVDYARRAERVRYARGGRELRLKGRKGKSSGQAMPFCWSHSLFISQPREGEVEFKELV